MISILYHDQILIGPIYKHIIYDLRVKVVSVVGKVVKYKYTHLKNDDRVVEGSIDYFKKYYILE